MTNLHKGDRKGVLGRKGANWARK